jgi:hypothetical protein
MLLTVVSQMAAVLPVTVYPPDLRTVLFDVRPWHPVHDDVTWASVNVEGGVDVQACARTGVPPVQPPGDDVATVLVWVLLDRQAPHAEYVNEVQAVTGGT